MLTEKKYIKNLTKIEKLQDTHDQCQYYIACKKYLFCDCPDEPNYVSCVNCCLFFCIDCAQENGIKLGNKESYDNIDDLENEDCLWVDKCPCCEFSKS